MFSGIAANRLCTAALPQVVYAQRLCRKSFVRSGIAAIIAALPQSLWHCRHFGLNCTSNHRGIAAIIAVCVQILFEFSLSCCIAAMLLAAAEAAAIVTDAVAVFAMEFLVEVGGGAYRSGVGGIAFRIGGRRRI